MSNKNVRVLNYLDGELYDTNHTMSQWEACALIEQYEKMDEDAKKRGVREVNAYALEVDYGPLEV